MISTFLFILTLIFLVCACVQDFKRREIDDWLNILLYFSGTFYIFVSFYSAGFSLASYGFFSFVIMLISIGMYQLRFFAGGDAKLLFALTPLFYEFSFYSSLINFFIFVLLFILAGALYGAIYLFYIFFKNRKEVSKEFKKNLKNSLSAKLIFVFSFILFCLSYVDINFLFLAILVFLGDFLFLSGKALEKSAFVIYKKYNEVTEGDWLVKDLKIGRRVIPSNWDGLSFQDVKLIKKYRKNVLIKEGIPYAFAFFVAFIIYYFAVSSWVNFLKEVIVTLIRG
jgi:Flp pilus assembly protein protease CpaA